MNNNNVFLAVVLSLGILLGFQYLYAKPHQEALRTQYLAQEMDAAKGKPSIETTVSALQPRETVIKATPRVAIATPELSGSINLKGARIDDLSLVKYHETEDPKSPAIVLLSPSGSERPQAYYAQFSWLADLTTVGVPNENTLWKANGNKLSPDTPVRLTWNNGQGLTFERTIAVDADAMFTITDRVVNAGDTPIVLFPFGTVARQGEPVVASSAVHEGPLGVLDGKLSEVKYKKLISEGKITQESQGGWLGITEKYWLIAMVPPQDEKVTAQFNFNQGNAATPADGFFQSDFRGNAMTVPANGSVEHVVRLFAGAKRLSLLDRYADAYNIPHFDRAIDFGWFYFLTRPFLQLLSMLEKAVGSMGIAILLFTVLLKLVTLPLSQKSYVSMVHMKTIQPEIERINKRYADDPVRRTQETMDLYKREKVNPVSGCFPTLIQIPIFFALYKVLYVNIEMRQAPFFGWIRDMSLPDPTSVLNLFGAIPVQLPYALQIGVWPILMGISMFLQQKLSPQPPDKAQARMFMFMPIFFTYLLVHMPAGLVIYWTWSNLLGILQQWYIYRKHGVKVDLTSTQA